MTAAFGRQILSPIPTIPASVSTSTMASVTPYRMPVEMNSGSRWGTETMVVRTSVIFTGSSVKQHLLPFPRCRMEVNSHADGIDDDPVLALGGLDRNLFVENIPQHRVSITSARIAPSSCPWLHMADHVPGLQYVGHHCRQDLLAFRPRVQDVPTRRPGLSAVQTIGRVLAAVGPNGEVRGLRACISPLSG